MPKKFVFEVEDGTILFEDYLSSMQCEATNKNGNQCTKRCVIGVPYCWIHLQYQYKLKIKPSTIENGGLGLFAFDKKAGNQPIFEKGQKIIKYVGEQVTREELDDRYGDDHIYTAPYAIQVNKNLFLDSALIRGVGSLANHSSKRLANCEFTNPNRNKEIYLRATKPIYHNDEILVNYNNQYRFDEPVNHKTINVRK